MLLVLKAPTTFSEWRSQARNLVEHEVHPDRVNWTSVGEHSLFPSNLNDSPRSKTAVEVPKRFVQLAATVSAHRSPLRWTLMYQALWRLTHGEPELLSEMQDRVTVQLQHMRHAVLRDAEKLLKAVEFQLVKVGREQVWVGWFSPQHQTLPLVAEVLSNRFHYQRWALFSPTESIYWDRRAFVLGSGVPACEAPHRNAFKEFWLSVAPRIFGAMGQSTSTRLARTPRVISSFEPQHYAAVNHSGDDPSVFRSASSVEAEAQVERQISLRLIG